MPISIDYDFFLKAGLLYKTKFYLIKQPLIKYRVHSQQLSHQNITQSLSYLEEIRKETMSKLDPEAMEKYLSSLEEYNKKKPITKKSLESGLKIFSTILPPSIFDKFLVFYLNKIRQSR